MLSTLDSHMHMHMHMHTLDSQVHLFVEPPWTDDGEARQEVFAFNANGSLWFSVRAFTALHGHLSCWHPSVTCFWFVTMIHEAAHHIAPGHDARHEMLMERMLEAFLPRLITEHVQQSQQSQLPRQSHQPHPSRPSYQSTSSQHGLSWQTPMPPQRWH